jgi:hypothetical protein
MQVQAALICGTAVFCADLLLAERINGTKNMYVDIEYAATEMK